MWGVLAGCRFLLFWHHNYLVTLMSKDLLNQNHVWSILFMKSFGKVMQNIFKPKTSYPKILDGTLSKKIILARTFNPFAAYPCRHGTYAEAILNQCNSFRSEPILNVSWTNLTRCFDQIIFHSKCTHWVQTTVSAKELLHAFHIRCLYGVHTASAVCTYVLRSS